MFGAHDWSINDLRLILPNLPHTKPRPRTFQLQKRSRDGLPLGHAAFLLLTDRQTLFVPKEKSQGYQIKHEFSCDYEPNAFFCLVSHLAVCWMNSMTSYRKSIHSTPKCRSSVRWRRPLRFRRHAQSPLSMSTRRDRVTTTI